MLQDLQKAAKPAGADRKPPSSISPPTPVAPATPEPAKPEPADPDDPLTVDPAATAAPADPKTEPAKPGEKQKVNPWKLLDETKAARAKVEQELAELRKLVPDEAARKAEVERFAEAQKRAQELEEHIRFVDYSKSQEFQDKYQKPYEQAWSKAMRQLTQVMIEGDDGNPRQVNAQDLQQIVNLPLGQAQDLADEKFGKFSSAVMLHREKIQDLFDQQSAALDEAKKNGAERDRKRTEEWLRSQGEVRRQISETWTKANEAAVKDERVGKFFQQIEGDTEWNQRLGKGFEIVDRAMNENALDPKLTPEQRVSVIKRHSALRHRAAAFGPLVYRNNQLTERLAKLEAELKQFTGTVPDTSGGTPATATPQPMSAHDQVFGALRKLAK